MKFSLLLSKGFLVGLFILLLNDALLKDYFGNWVTGKLSDFAGIFIFPLFLTALFPRYRRFNYIFTILFFVFWKTELSQPLINFITSNGFAIGRVIDYTDFMAFIMLPLSYLYSTNHKSIAIIRYQKPLAYLVGCLAFIIFSATSRVYNGYNINEKYKSSLSKQALLDSIKTFDCKLYMDTLGLQYDRDTVYIADFTPNNIQTNTWREDTLQIRQIHFRIKKRRKGSKIHVLRVFTDDFRVSSYQYNKNIKAVEKITEKLMIEPFR